MESATPYQMPFGPEKRGDKPLLKEKNQIGSFREGQTDRCSEGTRGQHEVLKKGEGNDFRSEKPPPMQNEEPLRHHSSPPIKGNKEEKTDVLRGDANMRQP